jgi:exopolysaccharide biosynthesis polyprenyl glycosylphosphotransferase
LKRFRYFYFALDFFVALLVWLSFWVIRKKYIEVHPYWLFDALTALKAVAYSLFWCFLYWLGGLYSQPYRKSRLREIGLLLQLTPIGVIIIAFISFLDDPLENSKALRSMAFAYIGLQFLAAASARFLLSTRIKKKIASKELGFRTIIIGCGKRAYKLWQEIEKNNPEFHIQGYLSLPDATENLFLGKLKRYGPFEQLPQIIRNRKIEDLIIALEKSDHEQLREILGFCEETNIKIYVDPDLYDFMVGNVKMHSVLGAPLIEVYPHLIKPWEAICKRALDICLSIVMLIVCLPFFAALAILIKWDSPGPVFFLQERCGKNGIPFQIIKFRSMYTDAEKMGPALSSDNDPRITKIGKILRKYRLDEFPQFYNVLVGDMSLVGPRPERKFFIEQIVKKAPEYLHLLKVKPGITSLGQVKYGYAENVDQMIERMKYDILYIENMSLLLDIKIITYTIQIIFAAKGK